MTQEQIFDRIAYILRTDYRHKDYDRTTDVASWGFSMMTGHGQEEYINLREKESKAQKEQRARLYNSATPIAARQVSAIYNKVRRTDNIKRIAEHDNEQSETALSESLDTFYADQALSEYLYDRLEYFAFYDPNAWIICERTTQVDADGNVLAVRPYPLEVLSEQVADFGVTLGIADYLVMFTLREVAESGDPLYDWYGYVAGSVVHFHQVDGERAEMEGYDPVTILTDANRTQYYLVRTFETGATEFPGRRAGCYADAETQGRTFITPLHYAENVFSDLIRDKANHDLNKTLHHYPQKYAYAPMCKYEDMRTGERCTSGKVNDRDCPQCHGSGALFHMSDQDVVVIAYDADNEAATLPALSNFAFYVNLPDWLPKWMAEEIDACIRRVFVSVFATQVDGREMPGPVTATEKVLDWEQVYNLLQPYAENYSLTFELMGRVSAQYLELDPAGLTVMHRFPLDFKMATVAELIDNYRVAKAAGVSMDVLTSIELDIIAKQNRNRPDLVANWEAFQLFLPFRDKSPEMIGFILSARRETDADRVLYENFAAIQSEVQQELDVWFYQVPFSEQKRLIAEAVERKRQSVQYLGGFEMPPEISNFE